jgi:hypothetical protein
MNNLQFKGFMSVACFVFLGSTIGVIIMPIVLAYTNPYTTGRLCFISDGNELQCYEAEVPKSYTQLRNEIIGNIVILTVCCVMFIASMVFMICLCRWKKTANKPDYHLMQTVGTQ